MYLSGVKFFKITIQYIAIFSFLENSDVHTMFLYLNIFCEKACLLLLAVALGYCVKSEVRIILKESLVQKEEKDRLRRNSLVFERLQKL